MNSGLSPRAAAWSYVDQFNISVLTDDATVDDPHEVTDAMMRAFTEIREARLDRKPDPGWHGDGAG